MENESTAAQRGFLGRIPAEDASELEARGARRRFDAGEALMHEGDPGEEVMVLLAGRVKVTFTTADGKEIVLGFCGPGDLLGELSVLDDAPRSSSVIALEAGESLVLGGPSFRKLIADRPALALELLRTISRRFRGADRLRIEFAASTTLPRVAARLLELAEVYGEETGEGVVIDLRISQEELAGWTGSSREAVAKALQTLRELGLVITDRRRLTVVDPEGLRGQAP